MRTLITSIMILALISCNKEEQPSPFIGTWYCINTTETYVYSDTELDIQDVVNGVPITHYVIPYTKNDEYITYDDNGYVFICSYEIVGHTMWQTNLTTSPYTLKFVKQ